MSGWETWVITLFVGEDVFELRIFYGPGYRVCFGFEGDTGLRLAIEVDRQADAVS